MYQKEIIETCYMCEAPKTSKEHVPPQCIFPEQKDSPDGIDYRKNLIKVPSCDAHNSAKSKEDEFFLMYMAVNAFTNQAAKIHQNTKLLRILDRKPHVWGMLLAQAKPATIIGSDGKVHSTCTFHIDADRFHTQMEHIAKGIYFKHFSKKWLSDVVVIPTQGLLTDNATANASNRKVHKISSEIFSEIERHGNNQDVFYYQVAEEASGVLVLAAFYENVKVIFLYSQNG